MVLVIQENFQANDWGVAKVRLLLFDFNLISKLFKDLPKIEKSYKPYDPAQTLFWKIYATILSMISLGVFNFINVSIFL